MRWRILFTGLAVVLLAAAVGVLALGKPAAGDCSSGPVHVVTIQGGQVNPAHTDAKLCESLTIKNLDKQSRLMAFGPHEEHVPYNGIAERLLGQGESFTVTLNQAGSFRFHDHLDDEAQGTFSVAEK